MSRKHAALIPLGAFLLVFSYLAGAQQDTSSSGQGTGDQEKSLAEIVKQAKQKKTAHAKKLVTEDELAAKGPLPRLSFDDVDNSDDIVEAIGVYQAKHSKEETEQVLHDWYEEYDTMLITAIHNTTEARDRRDSTLFTGFQLCQQSTDYQKCELKRQAEMRGARHDQLAMRDYTVTISRVQQAFMKIRNSLGRYDLHYDWFKIRNANGVGSF
jgi:hypothetical protein